MMRFKSFFAVAFGLLLAAGAALADNYPSKPVVLLVPYPPGGPADSLARIVNGPLSKLLEQTVLVENLGGVGGTLGAQKVLSAPADGHYVFQGSPNEVMLAPLVNAAVKIRPEDFRLIHPISNGVLVLVASKDLPVRSADDLVELARRPSEKPLTYGSVGIGSLNHLIVEDMQRRVGTKAVHVAYKGSAPLLQDLVGGQISFAVLVYGPAVGAMAEQGRLKLIGQFPAKRSELLKDVPTVGEGRLLKGFQYTTWAGFMLPKNVPEAIAQRLNQALAKVMQDPQVRSQLAAQVLEAAAPMSLSEAERFYQAESTGYREVARAIGLQPQ
ncbi:MAG: tripartite tricarboxylate transporter substrate binding protein [Burkholderiaceae bacterium]